MSTEVLQVVATTDRRGAEVFAVDLETALHSRGRGVRTFALAPGHSHPALPLETLGRRRVAPATLVRLRGEISRAEVVVGHGSTTLPACAIAATGTAKPFVYRSVGDPSYWASRRSRRLRVGLLLGRASAVVALTEGAAAAISRIYRVPPDKVRVIPKGVNKERFPLVDPQRRARARHRYRIDPGRQVVAYIGALSSEKNVGDAIRAIGCLAGVELVIAGSGPERASLESLAGRSAAGRVRFLGGVADSAEVLAAADVVVLASRTEGLPGVLMEAGLSGLPVVATDVGWVREIVVAGETGIIVPSGDVGALAAGLRHGLEAPGEMGRCARDHCSDRFDMERIAERWCELFDELGVG